MEVKVLYSPGKGKSEPKGKAVVGNCEFGKNGDRPRFLAKHPVSRQAAS